ncbi:MAG: phosphoribosylamine--glycine ligase [Bacteroidales bacterium]|jgi:phosphoribosylamine--glycine ligase
MNILIIGSGGREHAIALNVSKSILTSKVYIAPGNGGTASLGENVNIDVNDFANISNFISEKNIEMVVVGPEVPLSYGITDYLNKKHENLKIIGPNAKAALLESSKNFSKNFMVKYDIPTAKFKSFTKNEIEEAISFLKKMNPPYVLKADGLAAGKGVLILDDFDDAVKELKNMLLNEKFGNASKQVLIEEFLDGIELSVFIITDGEDYVLLPEAKDYKRIGENDTGLNTGGMGSISPVPFVTDEFIAKVKDKIIEPTLKGLQAEEIKYVGFIFFGLINCNGNPYVIEYNCRMGDPETESVFPRIKSDIVQLFLDTANNNLRGKTIEIDKRNVATVMLTAKGYPQSYNKGMEILIDNENIDENNDIIFHAGTKLSDNKLVTNGGRVITATAYGNNVKDAFDNAYKLSEKITFDQKYLRKDLGKDLL